SSSWLVPGDADELGATLLLTADQAATDTHPAVHVETTFTDGPSDKYTVSITPTTQCAGASTMYKFRITMVGSSIAKSFTLTKPAGTITSVSATAFNSSNVSKGSWTDESISGTFKFKSPASGADLIAGGDY